MASLVCLCPRLCDGKEERKGGRGVHVLFGRRTKGEKALEPLEVVREVFVQKFDRFGKGMKRY
jgi:hypothetical protein